MSVRVHSALVLVSEIVGVRFQVADGNYFDVEVSVLEGVKESHLKGVKIQKLIPKGDLLVTEEELNTNMIVKDATSDSNYVKSAIKALLTEPPVKPPTSVKKIKKFKKKAFFDVVVKVPMYDLKEGKWIKIELKGEFEATNALVARKKAKEFYAHEHGTEPKEIEVVDAKIRD